MLVLEGQESRKLTFSEGKRASLAPQTNPACSPIRSDLGLPGGGGRLYLEGSKGLERAAKVHPGLRPRRQGCTCRRPFGTGCLGSGSALPKGRGSSAPEEKSASENLEKPFTLPALGLRPPSCCFWDSGSQTVHPRNPDAPAVSAHKCSPYTRSLNPGRLPGPHRDAPAHIAPASQQSRVPLPGLPGRAHPPGPPSRDPPPAARRALQTRGTQVCALAATVPLASQTAKDPEDPDPLPAPPRGPQACPARRLLPQGRGQALGRWDLPSASSKDPPSHHLPRKTSQGLQSNPAKRTESRQAPKHARQERLERR